MTLTSMKKKRIIILYALAWLAALILIGSCSDMRKISPAQFGKVLIHSHNDYAQARPFWGAWEAGAASIEAEIWLVEGALYVGHDRKDITEDRMLLGMYLEPIRQVMQRNGGQPYADGRPLQLMVDLKNEGELSLQTLVALIESNGLVPCFDRAANPLAVCLTITTGSDIPAGHWDRYPDWVCFDGRPDWELTAGQLERVSLVSQSYGKYSDWTGFGRMSTEEQDRIEKVAAQVHAEGKRFRLWGFPDTKRGWEMAVGLGIDYINTDQPARAAAWLSDRTR